MFDAPIGRQHRIESRLARNPARYCPADVTAGVAGHKILRWHRHRVGDVECLGDGRSRLHFQQVQVDAFGLVRNPADDDFPVRIVHIIDYRSPDRFPNRILNRLAVFDIDRLDVCDELLVTLRGLVGTLGRARPQDDRIGPVAVAVRKTPRDLRVATANNEWRTWQRHTGDITPFRTQDSQACLIPDIRHPVSQVHIVRDECAPIRRQCA